MVAVNPVRVWFAAFKFRFMCGCLGGYQRGSPSSWRGSSGVTVRVRESEKGSLVCPKTRCGRCCWNIKPEGQPRFAGVVLWTSCESGQNTENLKLQHEMVKQRFRPAGPFREFTEMLKRTPKRSGLWAGLYWSDPWFLYKALTWFEAS